MTHISNLKEITYQTDAFDYLVLEVGIGGRLDATNYLTPHLTAITSISRDHEDLLGKGYKNIVIGIEK